MEERNPKTNIRQFTEALANIEHVEHGDAWKKFFLDVDLVKDVSLALTSDVSAQMAVIAAGGLWQGGGWNSSTASKRLYSLTGVPVVSSDFSVYRGAFLFSLASFWQLDLPEANLPDRSAEAAFALLGLYESTAEQDGEQPAEDEESDGEDGLPWDEQLAKLPSDLRVIWGRAQQF